MMLRNQSILTAARFLFTLPALCVLHLAASRANAAPNDIKDVFVRLPAACFAQWAGEGEIPLADPAKRKALTAATGDQQQDLATAMSLREVVIDTKNGFLKVESNGDGEGMIFTMTLWNAADGTKLAGVAIERWTNVANDTPYIAFFRVKDDMLTDVSSGILPAQITLESFFDTNKDIVKAAAKDGFRWWWVLPRKGTTLEVKSPSMELIDEYAKLEKPDHAYEGRWDGKKFTWVKVKPKAPAE